MVRREVPRKADDLLEDQFRVREEDRERFAGQTVQTTPELIQTPPSLLLSNFSTCMTAIIIAPEHHGMLPCFYRCFFLLWMSLLFHAAINEKLSLGKDKQLIPN